MTRVVVTGIGLITPVGNDTASTWDALVAGRSAGDGPLADLSGVVAGLLVGDGASAARDCRP